MIRVQWTDANGESRVGIVVGYVVKDTETWAIIAPEGDDALYEIEISELVIYGFV